MRTYEELTGAEGRRMFYRAERFRPEDLFREAVPAVFFICARQFRGGRGPDALRARRLALDAALRAQGVQVDALESRARLLLDGHRLWDFEPEY